MKKIAILVLPLILTSCAKKEVDEKAGYNMLLMGIVFLNLMLIK